MWRSPRIGLQVAPGAVHAYDLRRRTALGVHASIDEAMAPFERSRAQVHVVLSDAHCRYLVTNRPAGLRHRGELNAFVRSRFHSVFGDADAWNLRLSASPRATHDFVSALDAASVANIESRAAASGLRIVSMRSHWVAWAHHFQAQLRRGRHWVIGANGDWASVGYVSGGQCLHARALRLDADITLADVLMRERAFVGDDALSAAVWLGGDMTVGLPDHAGNPATTQVGPGALWGVRA